MWSPGGGSHSGGRSACSSSAQRSFAAYPPYRGVQRTGYAPVTRATALRSSGRIAERDDLAAKPLDELRQVVEPLLELGEAAVVRVSGGLRRSRRRLRLSGRGRL